MQSRPTLAFGDDGSPAADVCWLWINSHTWPGWRLEIITAQGAAIGPPPTPEACDGLDSDCDGLTDEELGQTTCGVGACRNTVENCAGGVLQTCVPLPPSTCDAPPAYCHTTTEGTDGCGNPCTKVGPEHCYTVHPACLDSSPGTPTDTATCDTPRGRYDCGLTCEEWPNPIGADCEHCVNIVCEPRSGPDEAQFRCNNPPMPPTP